MKQELKNLVQLLNSIECDLNNHKNPHFYLTLLTFEDDPSVTFKINTKILRMALKLCRQHYVRNRKKDTFYPPGMHPAEIRERALREKKYASEPDYTPKDIKTVTYLDEPQRTEAIKLAAKFKNGANKNAGVDKAS